MAGWDQYWRPEPPTTCRRDPYSVVAVLYDARGWVLAVSRRGAARDLGFPGGKVEPGEAPRVALERELLEDTTIVAHDLEEIFEAHADERRIEPGPCRAYWVRSWSGIARSGEPGLTVRWVPWSRMMSAQNTYRDYNRRLYQHLGAGRRA